MFYSDAQEVTSLGGDVIPSPPSLHINESVHNSQEVNHSSVDSEGRFSICLETKGLKIKKPPPWQRSRVIGRHLGRRGKRRGFIHPSAAIGWNSRPLGVLVVMGRDPVAGVMMSLACMMMSLAGGMTSLVGGGDDVTGLRDDVTG